MENSKVLEEWKKMKAKEEKDNPYGKFIIDEGEYVVVTSGVKQLKVEELKEEVEENDDTRNKSCISK